MKRFIPQLLFAASLAVLGGCCVPPESPVADSATAVPVSASPTPTAVQPTLIPLPTTLPASATPLAQPQMSLASSAFDDGGEMPLRHAQRTFDDPGGWTVACPGENISPPLGWSNVPPEAESLVITCYDHITLCEKCKPLAPRGRVWGHWGVYNIPPTSSGLAEGLPADSVLPDGSRQVVNEYNEVGYGGPCPPPEHTHSYVFTLYALDTTLDLPEGASVAELSAVMEGHILAQVELMGIFVGR